jgi:hypothetical protein
MRMKRLKELGLLVLALSLVSIPVSLSIFATKKTKGIMFDGDVILKNLPRPSLRELELDGFSMIGVGVISSYNPNEFRAHVAPFIKAAHRVGFQVFTMIANRTGIIQDAQLAAMLGVDMIDFDEPLIAYHPVPEDLGAAMDAALSIAPNIRFLVNEWAPDDLQKMYAWSANRTNVDIAEDNYAYIGIIDYNIYLANMYHKSAYNWLIVYDDPTITDTCFHNLAHWISYAALRPTNTLYFMIDSAGRWQQTWSSIVATEKK